MTPTSDRIANFLDDAVAGLADDPELRLDIRAELTAHIAEALDGHRSGGMSEDDAVDLVLRSLGSPLEVAGDLQSANRGRMRMRGLVRLVLRGLVVPAALIVGVFNTARPVHEARGTTRIFNNTLSGATGFFDWLPGHERYPRHLDEDQRLIVYGDLTRATRAETQKAIWERFPDNPVYFGNYVSSCLYDESVDLEEVFQQGESLEPDNARFGYLRAAAQLEDAASITNLTIETAGEEETEQALVIHDREGLDRALGEYVSATEKPWMRTYSREMLLRRFELLPRPKRYVDLIHRTVIAAAVILPDVQEILHLSRISPLYAAQLVEEGKTDQAEQVLGVWYPMLCHRTDDSFTLIEALVLSAAAKAAGGREVQVREQLGQVALAEQAQARMEAFVQPIEAWKERRENPDPELESLDELVQARGGLLARHLLPGLGPGSIRPEELDANRWTEYVLMERLSLAALSASLLVILFVLGIVAIAGRLFSAGRSIPILMVPTWRKMLKIIGFGVALPLVAYALYSRLLPLAGRGYSFEYVRLKLLAELILLGITIVVMTWISARDYVRERCTTYGLSMPGQLRAIRWLPAALLGLTWIVLLAAPVGPGSWTAQQSMAAGLTGLLVLATFVAGIRFLVVGLAGQKSHRLYYGTMARSLMPVLAAAILVIGWVGMPYLSAAEKRLIQKDMLFGNAAMTGGFSAPEARLTEGLLAEIRANLQALEEQESRN